jgi:hypothetical protein
MRLMYRIWKLAIVVAVLASSGADTRAQQPASLPSNWQSLSPTDFVKAVLPFYDPGTESVVGNVDPNALRAQSTSLITNIDFSSTTLDYSTLNGLHLMANLQLAEADQARILSGLLARQDDWTGHPYSDLRAKLSLMYRLKAPALLRIQEGRRWAQTGGTLASVPLQDVPEAYLYFQQIPVQAIDGSFAVHWAGLVTVPQTGAYTFGISPINVNSLVGKHPVAVTMSVNLGGNALLSATPAQWTVSSQPVNLTAGQPVAITVDWSVHGDQQLPNRALHTLLYWQGPGLASSIVPAASLSLPDGSGAGLQTTYTWTDNTGQPQTLTRTEPNIDAAWTSGPVWLLSDPTVTAQAADTLWQNATAPAYLAQLASNTGFAALHPFFKDPDLTASILTSARRKAFLDLLQAQPALLSAASAKQIGQLYGAYRIGASDDAIQTYIAWANQHADWQPAIPMGNLFDPSARMTFRRLALEMTVELPSQFDQLRTQGLTTQDGRCCLPVAYILAYGYLGQNKLHDWAQTLNDLLNNPTVAGDLRTNWLLARALVQEIRQGRPNLYKPIYERPMDGKSFVDQAGQAAQSQSNKVRVALEAAGRLASVQQFDAATAALQQVQNGATADQQKLLTNWLTQISALSAAQTALAANQDAAARQTYLNTLRQRLNQATSRGDTAAVDRYNALLNAAGNP